MIIVEIFKYFGLGFFACLLALLPLGLVNLSVIDTTINSNSKNARLVSFGAAFTEVFFAAIAIFIGFKVKDFFIENTLVKFFVLLVFTASALYFYFRKQNYKTQEISNSKFFLKGFTLNLISLQVFSFWLIAVFYFFSEKWIKMNSMVIALIFGIFIGKVFTLEFYIFLTKKIQNKIAILPKYTNKFMALIFSILSIIQILRIVL